MNRQAHPTWDEEEVFQNGDAFFSGLAGELEHAQWSIDLETYIFADDELGRKIAARLRRAAERGVRVRVMVDAFGSPEWGSIFASEFRLAHVEARVYHPFPWSALFGALSRFPWITRLLLMLSNANRRNHRKVCVIDGRVAWLGSMNITDRHLAAIHGSSAWRDTGIRVRGGGVADLTWAFERAWSQALSFNRRTRRWRWRFPGFRRRQPPASGLIRLNATRRQRASLNLDLVARLEGAKRRVWITNAYFVPNRQTTHSLAKAARAGVDVRILVPQRPDVSFVRWVSAVLFSGLLQAGARIFEYRPSVLHAKTVLIDDDFAMLGSSNLNHRSIIHDLEADVILTASRSLNALRSQFIRDASNSSELSLAHWKHRPWMARLAGRLLYALRYWI